MNKKIVVLLGFLSTLAWLALVSTTPGQTRSSSTNDFDVVLEEISVPARDGVALATDVYRPARNGAAVTERLPVILQRTPYNKRAPAMVAVAKYYAQHGYVSIVQDTRGRFASGGVFSKYYKYDAYDGYDTIEWAAKLPYSNGKLGMLGTSYGAHTQADASKLNPPHLTTMLLNMGGIANAWDGPVRFDGAFLLGRELSWAWGQIAEDAKEPFVKEMMAKEKVTDWYTTLPLRKGLSPLSVSPVYEKNYFDESTRSDYGDYWKAIGLNWEEYYRQTADVPMLHIGGWYDIWLRGTLENFTTLSQLKKSPIRLMIGPWTHGGNAVSHAGDVEFGPEAAIENFNTAFHLPWFEHYLKGLPTEAEKQPMVRVFVMGTGDGHKDAAGRLFHGGYWRDAPKWPIPEARVTSFYLHADGSLSTKVPSASEAGKTTYTFDPNHPVPTVGGGVSPRLKDGAYDQRERADLPGSRPPYLPLRSRSDVVVFQTEPLKEDTTIVGPIDVRLFASSTGVDTDFTAKLVDVYPPSNDFPQGFDMNLTDGIVRASYRDRAKTRKLIAPGTVYEFEVRPFPTANVFKKGHRIRLDISSSNFPRFDANPNTGEPLGLNRRAITVNNSIYHDAKHASFISLPIVTDAKR